MAKKAKKKVTVAATLRAALRALKNGKAWAQNALAYDKTGDDVDATDPEAVKFCSIGVLEHVDGPKERQATSLLAKVIKKNSPYRFIADFNDANETQFKDVKKMFNRAIRKAVAEKR